MNERWAPTVLPRWYRGVTQNHVGVQRAFAVLGFDTETCEGIPYHVGLYDGQTFLESRGLYKEHFLWLVGEVMKRQRPGVTLLVVSHGLQFDLGVLLFSYLFQDQDVERAPKKSLFPVLPKVKLHALLTRCDKLEGTARARVWGSACEKAPAIFEVFWGRPCFAKLRTPKGTVMFIDSLAYFTMKLKQALKMIDAPVRKLPKPKDLGKTVIPADTLRPYLVNDTKGHYYLGEQIVQWHRQYDVRLCVSAPQLAGRIFRHQFLKGPIKKPFLPVRWFSMLSYHGGKNALACEPGTYRDCYELDINAAYPEAMRQLPDFVHGDWQTVRAFAGVHGVYCVSGWIKACAWGSLFSHDFKKLDGPFSDVWVTGYEIEDALARGDLILTDCRGYVWRARKGRAGVNPFVAYVDHFFALKAQAKTEEERYFLKLMLNALYGKFLARSHEEDDDGVPYRKAGAMFHPFIGTLITGYVRAKVHRLEHKYRALHTATDSVKTLTAPDPQDLGDGIGQLKIAVFGDCLILRNKLYVHFDHRDPTHPKVGLHGFQESWRTLIRLHKLQRTTYTRRRLVRWAEAWHLGQQPGQERRIPMCLRL